MLRLSKYRFLEHAFLECFQYQRILLYDVVVGKKINRFKFGLCVLETN